MKRICALFTAALFIIQSTIPVFAKQESPEISQLCLDEVSEDKISEYLGYNVTFNDTTIFTIENVASTISGENGYRETKVLKAQTLEPGDQAREDVFFFYDENGNLVDADLNMLTTSTISGSSTGSYTGIAFTITATMSYNIVYIDSYEYYQPVSASFYYSPKSNFVSGNFNVNVNYITYGVEKRIADLSVTQSNYEKEISISKTNPQANTIYRASTAVDTTKVVDIWSGYFQGMWINVSGSYRGSSFTSTVAGL